MINPHTSLIEWGRLFYRVGLPHPGRNSSFRALASLRLQGEGMRGDASRVVADPVHVSPKAASPLVAPFKPVEGPLAARMIGLRVWLSENFSPKVVHLCDQHGLPVEGGIQESAELGTLALFRGTHKSAQNFLSGSLLPYIVVPTTAGGLANLFFCPGFALGVITLRTMSNEEMAATHAAFLSAIGEGV